MNDLQVVFVASVIVLALALVYAYISDLESVSLRPRWSTGKSKGR